MRTCSWILLLGMISPMTAEAVGVVESGHTAVWRDRARAGEGVTLEILGSDTASLTWFTYDDDGGQRWAYGLGNIVRNGADARIEFPQLLMTEGGRFGTDYDASEVTTDAVGSATLTFADCDRGVFEVEAFGQSLSLPLERLTKTMAAGCAPIHGVIGEPVKSYAAQTGVWSNPARRGQGLQLQWMSRDEAGLAWFTFDADGNRYWLSGVGKYDDGKIVFPQMIATRGARFGSAFDPADVEIVDWGSVEMEIDCDSGIVRHASKLAEFGAGEQPIFLLTRPIDGACPWVRPKLTDLYTVSLERLPNGVEGSVASMSVANDGTVTALSRTQAGKSLLRRRLGEGTWDVVATALDAIDSLFVAPDGEAALVSLRVGTVDSGSTYTPTLLDDSGPAAPLTGLVFESSIVQGASLDLAKVVGRGRVSEIPRDAAWIWEADSGQRTLTVEGEISHATPYLVGNDAIVVGKGGSPTIPNTGFFNVPHYFAMRWNSEGATEVLRDTEGRVLATPAACGESCATIIGNGRLDGAPFMPNPPSAWYWKSPTDSALLTSFDGDTEWAGYTYWAADVSGDGSLVTGSMYHDLEDGGQEKDALVWTQDTGAVAVTPLLATIGELLPWDGFVATAISANGRFILLQGTIPTGPSSVNTNRAALLRLEPRSAADSR